jgi:hypothetical protein
MSFSLPSWDSRRQSRSASTERGDGFVFFGGPLTVSHALLTLPQNSATTSAPDFSNASKMTHLNARDLRELGLEEHLDDCGQRWETHNKLLCLGPEIHRTFESPRKKIRQFDLRIGLPVPTGQRREELTVQSAGVIGRQ